MQSINLIKNAIKHTSKGRIEFGYRAKGNTLEFFVKDTSQGIKPESQKAIFKRFVQEGHYSNNTQEGAGLGLSIARSYAEMLGGKIWLESEAGKGSVFYFTIPFKTSNKPTGINKESMQDESRQNIPTNLSILIVEDDEYASYFLTRLQKITKNIIYAKTGRQAILLMRQHVAIDLILMDIRMPEMNGLIATEKIRVFNKEVIIIAQAAYALSGDKEKAIAAGCNDYIAKPVKKDALLNLIQKFFPSS